MHVSGTLPEAALEKMHSLLLTSVSGKTVTSDMATLSALIHCLAEISKVQATLTIASCYIA
jgi:hypothetical protein